MSCYLTYQPLQNNAEDNSFGGIPFYFKWFANGAATKKVYLTITHTSEGGLNFSYHYQTAALSEKDIELFYYYMMRIVFMGIRADETTVGQIMESV